MTDVLKKYVRIEYFFSVNQMVPIITVDTIFLETNYMKKKMAYCFFLEYILLTPYESRISSDTYSNKTNNRHSNKQ